MYCGDWPSGSSLRQISGSESWGRDIWIESWEIQKHWKSDEEDLEGRNSHYRASESRRKSCKFQWAERKHCVLRSYTDERGDQSKSQKSVGVEFCESQQEDWILFLEYTSWSSERRVEIALQISMIFLDLLEKVRDWGYYVGLGRDDVERCRQEVE